MKKPNMAARCLVKTGHIRLRAQQAIDKEVDRISGLLAIEWAGVLGDQGPFLLVHVFEPVPIVAAAPAIPDCPATTVSSSPTATTSAAATTAATITTTMQKSLTVS